MQVRFTRLAVFVLVCGAATAGCGKYSIGNIRSAKAFQDGTILYKKADYKGAVPLYEDSVRFNPEMGFAYFFLGNSYDNLYKAIKKDDPENMGYLTKAAQHYRTAIDKLANATDPKELEVRRNAFEYLIAIYGEEKLNDFSKAEPVAREFIASNPGEPATYRVLAKIYEDQGRFDEAEAQLLKAIDVKPTDAQGYQSLATFYNDRGDFGKQMDAWYKRATVEPKNPEAWHMIGALYQEKVFKDRKLPRAEALDYTLKGIEAEDKALAINPEYYLAMVYKNILMKQQALYERDPATVKRLLAESDVYFKKAEALRLKQTGDAGKDPAKAGGK